MYMNTYRQVCVHMAIIINMPFIRKTGNTTCTCSIEAHGTNKVMKSTANSSFTQLDTQPPLVPKLIETKAPKNLLQELWVGVEPMAGQVAGQRRTHKGWERRQFGSHQLLERQCVCRATCRNSVRREEGGGREEGEGGRDTLQNVRGKALVFVCGHISFSKD